MLLLFRIKKKNTGSYPPGYGLRDKEKRYSMFKHLGDILMPDGHSTFPIQMRILPLTNVELVDPNHILNSMTQVSLLGLSFSSSVALYMIVVRKNANPGPKFWQDTVT